MKNIYVLRAFGWQLDWRTDGWLPLHVRPGDGHDPVERARWHILPLGRLGCVTLGRMRYPKAKPGELGRVVVTLTADTRAFTATLDRVALQLRDMSSAQAHQLRIRRERALGMAYVHELLDEWRRDLGIEREDG